MTFGKRVVCCCPCSIKYDSRVCTSNRGRSVFLRNKAELFFDGTFFVRKLLGMKLYQFAIFKHSGFLSSLFSKTLNTSYLSHC